MQIIKFRSKMRVAIVLIDDKKVNFYVRFI